ncbi:DUF3168 domain-containing protein [Affinirhizobium pseudoryzae]|uniref:DUF3168 domain-containing protein n=1 Tax=Allorhizobium pseudoryzae TaxID=379684 RepID=UPI0013EDCE05|nr:DUF3168 domain-containing protein [Allorhizobium pseudoryzae]
MSAQQALLRAIHARLLGEPLLAPLLAAGGIRDQSMPRPRLPTLTYGEIDSRDYATATEPGEEHVLTLDLWSDAEGRAAAQTLAAAVRASLHHAPLTLTGAHLVSLICQGIKSRRDAESGLFVVEVSFRAVTE